MSTPSRAFQREAQTPQPQTYWQAAINQGRDEGRRIFYDDPDMQQMRQRRQDLSQGYDGKEMGALRESARREIGGQRQGYLNQLRTRMARQGVGGARGAAMQGAADQKFAQTGAEAERKMALDSAQLKRQGVSDLQDYLFRQKYGELGTGIGYGQMAIADQTANSMRDVYGSQGKDPVGGLVGGGLGFLVNPMLAPFAAASGYNNWQGVGARGNIGGWNWSF